MDIKINVKNKIADGDGSVIVCGNSDYRVVFDFDSEWDALKSKTMRVGMLNGSHADVPFEGEQCALPAIKARPWITIGVYAGDIHTTTPALFHCLECATDLDSEPLSERESELKTLTIKLGGATQSYAYSGDRDMTIEIPDAEEVKY